MLAIDLNIGDVVLKNGGDIDLNTKRSAILQQSESIQYGAQKEHNACNRGHSGCKAVGW